MIKVNRKGLFSILIATLLFSSMEIAIKLTDGTFNPIQLNFFRFLIGGLFLLPSALSQLRRSRYRFDARSWLTLSGLGALCVVFSMTLYNLSLHYIHANIAAILFAGNTFFAIGFAVLFLREKINKSVLIALAICFMGMLIIINPLNFKGSLIGVLCCLGSAITFALYGILGKKFTRNKPVGGVVLTCFAFLTGSAWLGMLMALSHLPAISSALIVRGLQVFANIPLTTGFTLQVLPLLLYIAICVTGIGYAAYFLALEETNTTFASLIFFIKPVLSPILTFFILREGIALNQLVGLVLIVVGSVLLFVTDYRKLRLEAKQPAPLLDALEDELESEGTVIVDITHHIEREIASERPKRAARETSAEVVSNQQP